MNLHVAILAAGKGTRMKSARPKVLHRVAGLPLIEPVLATAAALKPQTTTIVVGYQAAEVEEALLRHCGLTFVVQEPQLGTAHALLTTEQVLGDARGTLILLYGDVPLLSRATLENLVERHRSRKAAATVVTAIVDDPGGYGRIVRSGEQIARIVEEKDASSAEREIREINSGIYAFELAGLFDAVRSIATENAQREYYLTDLVAVYRKRGMNVETVTVPNADEIRGVNSQSEMAALSRIARDRKTAELMAAGVTIEDPATAYIDRDVTIGGDTTIGERVNIGAGTITCNYDGEKKNQTIIEDGAFIGSDSQLIAPVTIGAGAYVGSGATIREDVPSGALAVSAGKQRNIEGWVDKRGKNRKSDRKR